MTRKNIKNSAIKSWVKQRRLSNLNWKISEKKKLERIRWKVACDEQQCLLVIKWNQLEPIKKRQEQTENKQANDVLNRSLWPMLKKKWTIFCYLYSSNWLMSSLFFFTLAHPSSPACACYWRMYPRSFNFHLWHTTWTDHNSIWINLNCLTSLKYFTQINLHTLLHFEQFCTLSNFACFFLFLFCTLKQMIW